jgi:ABC-type uncharacterized transport system auxiliary subunit
MKARSGARFLFAALAALTLASGCSILPGEPPPVNLFTLPAPAARAAAPEDDATELRLRAVRAAGHLGSRIVWSTEGAERGYREYDRWIESPAAYLRRAAYASIAARPDLVRTERSLGRILDLELEEFEEHRGTPRSGRVVVRMTLLSPDGRVLHEDVFAAAVATEGGGVESLAHALAKALDEAVDAVFDRVREVAGTGSSKG